MRILLVMHVCAACSSQQAPIPNMTLERWTNTMQSIGTVTYEAPVAFDGNRAATKQVFHCELYAKLAATYPNAVCAGYVLRDRDDNINAIELQAETDRERGDRIIRRVLWKDGVPNLLVERAEKKGLDTDIVHAGVHYNYFVQGMGPAELANLTVTAN